MSGICSTWDVTDPIAMNDEEKGHEDSIVDNVLELPDLPIAVVGSCTSS